MNPIFTKRCNTNKSQCAGKRDLSSSFKKKCIRKSIYAYFSLSIDASPFLHSEEVEGRKERKEGGCLATGILHQTKKKKREEGKICFSSGSASERKEKFQRNSASSSCPFPTKKAPSPGEGSSEGSAPRPSRSQAPRAAAAPEPRCPPAMAPTGNRPPEGSGAILNQFPFLSLPFSTQLRRQRAAGPAHAARPRSLALPPRWPLPSGSALPSPLPERPPTPPQLFSSRSAAAPAAPAPLPSPPPVLPNCGATSPQPARPRRIARLVLVLLPSLPACLPPSLPGRRLQRADPSALSPRYPSAAARGWRRD